MKISLTLAGVVLLGSTLAACGGGDGSDGGGSGDGGGGGGDYCKDLKTAQSSFAKVSGNDFGALDSAIETFHQLAAEAPSEVKTDWKTLDGAFLKVEQGFKDAGIKMSDLGDIQAGKVPEGTTVPKLKELATTFSQIQSEKVTTAQDAIQKHAKDVCKVDLGAS
jgi:hypothetical protein